MTQLTKQHKLSIASNLATADAAYSALKLAEDAGLGTASEDQAAVREFVLTIPNLTFYAI